MRHKPMYNDLRLKYQDSDGNETWFYCSEISSNKQINVILNMPTKDSGVRYITTANIDFEVDGLIIQGDDIHRITAEPDIKPIKDNNSRRGAYRKVKVIDAT